MTATNRIAITSNSVKSPDESARQQKETGAIKNGLLTIQKVYPNPVTNELKILIGSSLNDKITFVVTDMIGRTIIYQQKNVAIGEQIISLDVSKLSEGSYYIKAVCNIGCERSLFKFIKH